MQEIFLIEGLVFGSVVVWGIICRLFLHRKKRKPIKKTIQDQKTQVQEKTEPTRPVTQKTEQNKKSGVKRVKDTCSFFLIGCEECDKKNFCPNIQKRKKSSKDSL